MRRIRSSGSEAELRVESALRSLRYGYRTHDRSLPGSPDLVLANHPVVIFVHGCFWHRHDGCRFAYTPKSRQAFWHKKFESNMIRDRRNVRNLRTQGWSVLTIWECQTRSPDQLRENLRRRILLARKRYEHDM